MTKVLNFPILIQEDQDGGYFATFPDVPGCVTQGETYEETLEHAKEALALCLEVAGEKPSYKAQINYPKTNTSRLIKLDNVTIQLVT
jgi:predicted RNase H-like HicB family nuclease